MRHPTVDPPRVRLLVRIGVAVLSVAVLAVTATAWTQLRGLDRSTPVAAVIDAPSRPASAEQNILLVGLDSRTDALGNPLPAEVLAALHAGGADAGGDTADSLTVVHVPAGGGRATAISVPRDAYVYLPGDLGRHKINSAYSRASQDTLGTLTSDGPAGTSSMFAATSTGADGNDPAVRRSAGVAGARATIGAVESLTGLPISHYAAVGLGGFADISQAVGGVPVCLRAPVDDPYSGAVFPAGPQRVSGAQALAFVRQRHGIPSGDLGRIARQQAFLASATGTLLSAGTLTDPSALSRLSAATSRSVTLDAGWDVLGFVRQLQDLSAGAVTFRTIPTGATEMSTPEDGLAVQVAPAQVRSFVAGSIAEDAGVPRPLPMPPSPVAPMQSGPTDVAADASSDGASGDDASGDGASGDGSSSDGSFSEGSSSGSSSDGSSSDGNSSDGTSTFIPPQMPPMPPITAAMPGCVD